MPFRCSLNNTKISVSVISNEKWKTSISAPKKLNRWALNIYYPFWRLTFQAGVPLELKIASRDLSLSWGASVKIFFIWQRRKSLYRTKFIWLYQMLQATKYFFTDLALLNTLRAGLIQAVRKKQLIRTRLCGLISPLLFALATRRKSQKMWQV